MTADLIKGDLKNNYHGLFNLQLQKHVIRKFRSI